MLGHSDSDGSRVPNQRDGWPWLLQDLLTNSGVETEIVHRLLFAGPSAAGFVQVQLDRERPDVVVLGTSTYDVVLQLVSNRVRETFGLRAATVAGNLERFVARNAGPSGSSRRRLTSELRKAGRKIVGTRSSLSVAGLIDSYEACFNTLARAENVHTLILGGVGYSSEQTRLNPSWPVLQDQIQARLRAAAVGHHFEWLAHEELLGGRQAKEHYYYPDGVHTDERSQKVVADTLLPLILAKR